MKKIFSLAIFIVTLSVVISGCGKKDPEPVQNLGQNVPADLGEWVEFLRAEGDLNGDGLSDRVVAFKRENEQPSQIIKNSRRLVIQLQSGQGDYRDDVEVTGALMCAACGQVPGQEPLESLVIKDGQFTITHRGGEYTYQWVASYSFALQDGEWKLVGEEAYTFDGNDKEKKRSPFDWDLGAQTPGETRLADFDVMLGVL